MLRLSINKHRALELDKSLPDAHYALAYSLEGQGKHIDALHEYFESARLNPNYVPALESIARYYYYMGDFDRALAMLDTIASIDPTINVHVRRAMCLYLAGRLQEALRENRDAEARAKRDVDKLTLIAFTYIWLGELFSAERVLSRIEIEEPNAFSISEISSSTIYGSRSDR